VGYQADLDDGASWLGLIYEENGRTIIANGERESRLLPTGSDGSTLSPKPRISKPLFKRGEWNSYRVTATASHVEIRVNGTLTAVLDDRQSNAAKFSGLIAFQLHSGSGPSKIQFRNIRLTNLGSTPFTSPPVATVPSAEATKGSVTAETVSAAARDSLRQQTSAVMWHSSLIQPSRR